MVVNTSTAYYKYTWATFSQPTLSANGTLGGSSFAVAASSERGGYSAWKAFADGWDVIWHSNGEIPCWYTFYNPKVLKISKIQILNDPEVGCGNGKLQGSNDNGTYTDICSFTGSSSAGATWSFNPNNTTPYKYFRFWFTASHYSGFIVIRKITLTAQVGTAGSGTSSNYDYTVVTKTAKTYVNGSNVYSLGS